MIDVPTLLIRSKQVLQHPHPHPEQVQDDTIDSLPLIRQILQKSGIPADTGVYGVPIKHHW